MRKFILTIILCFFCTSVYGQTYTTQDPIAFNTTTCRSTTDNGADRRAHFNVDPALALIEGGSSVAWLAPNTTNQRFHIDLNTAKIIRRIKYDNSHESGSLTNRGTNNFVFQGSNIGSGTFDDLVFANDEGWTNLTVVQSTFDEHTAANTTDTKFILVTNEVEFRYYAFKFADNHGDGSFMGGRNINLQTEDGFVPGAGGSQIIITKVGI